MIRFRNGKFWRVATATCDFRGPAPTSVFVNKGARVLYRAKDNEFVFPGDTEIHIVRNAHGLLTDLAKPAWPWKVPEYQPEPHGEPSRSPRLHQSREGQVGAKWGLWVEEASKDPEKVLEEDPDEMRFDPLDEFEFGPPIRKPVPPKPFIGKVRPG